MNIDGVAIGVLSPCRFVAEVSNAHNGDLTRAHRLIDAVATTGAEFVKFQAFTPSELVALRGDGPAPEPWGAQGWSMRDLYTKAQTPLAWLPELFAHARDLGLVPFSSVFGLESLAACEAVACPAYKMARLDNAQAWLRDAMRATGKPLLVSSYVGEPVHSDADLHLFCPPGYPAIVTELPHRFTARAFMDGPAWLGMSSHCLAPELPIAAVARGCKLIEMHIQLDDEPSALEANVSLTITQFRDMVQAVRRTEAMLA